jgi:hypothetical protein
MIEITRATEGSPRQKGPLEIVMSPFDDALVFGLSG